MHHVPTSIPRRHIAIESRQRTNTFYRNCTSFPRSDRYYILGYPRDTLNWIYCLSMPPYGPDFSVSPSLWHRFRCASIRVRLGERCHGTDHPPLDATPLRTIVSLNCLVAVGMMGSVVSSVTIRTDLVHRAFQCYRIAPRLSTSCNSTMLQQFHSASHAHTHTQNKHGS